MENELDVGCSNSDFLLNVKRNVIRFKSGSELSSSVNRMDVDVNEDITNEAHELKITLVLRVGTMFEVSVLIAFCSYPKCGTFTTKLDLKNESLMYHKTVFGTRNPAFWVGAQL